MNINSGLRESFVVQLKGNLHTASFLMVQEWLFSLQLKFHSENISGDLQLNMKCLHTAHLSP